MIITTNQLRERFDISVDASEAMLQNAIWEAENIDYKDAIGKDLYTKLNGDDALFNRYRYEDDSRHNGIENAILYLAYGRYIQGSNNGAATSSGFKVQDYLNGNEIDYRTKQKAENDAKNKGTYILSEVKACMIADGLCTIGSKNKKKVRFFI